MIAEGHVVGVVRQQDQKAALLRQARQHALEKHLGHIVVRDGRIAQRGQQLMLVAYAHRLVGEGNLHQVFIRRARQRLFEQGQVAVVFLGRQGHGRQLEHGNNLALFAHIAAADAGQVGIIHRKAAADFVQGFAVHHHYLP